MTGARSHQIHTLLIGSDVLPVPILSDYLLSSVLMRVRNSDLIMSKAADKEVLAHNQQQPEDHGQGNDDTPDQASQDSHPVEQDGGEEDEFPADYEPDYPDTVKELRATQQAYSRSSDVARK